MRQEEIRTRAEKVDGRSLPNATVLTMRES
jgi:hypothetical protein